MKLDYNSPASYSELRRVVGEGSSVVYYLATPPSTFSGILDALSEAGLAGRDLPLTSFELRLLVALARRAGLEQARVAVHRPWARLSLVARVAWASTSWASMADNPARRQ